jgi:hypothetical protein
MLLNADNIQSCYIGPEISPEEFIAEHFFLYLAKGKMHGYDGKKYNTLHSGEYCIVRKYLLYSYTPNSYTNVFSPAASSHADSPIPSDYPYTGHKQPSTGHGIPGLNRHFLE